MTGRGSPLRFLALVLGLWAAARIVMLWPAHVLPRPKPLMRDAFVGPVDPAPRSIARSLPVLGPVLEKGGSVRFAPKWLRAERHRLRATRAALIEPLPAVASPPSIAKLDLPERKMPSILLPLQATTAPAPIRPDSRRGSLPDTPPSARWSGSFWLIARDGRGIGASLVGSQIGGSQTGVRLAYALGDARRVAIVARVASPLSGPGQEAAIGLEWRPTRFPVRLLAEQRIGINGVRGGPAIGIVGGAGPLPIAAGLVAEGYGQAGIIGRDGGIGYADGSVRIGREVAVIGHNRLDLAVGGWGAIQPGAARLDIGPTIAARLPIGGKQVRLTIDWRQRVAGDARPGSGPAVSIGTDF